MINPLMYVVVHHAPHASRRFQWSLDSVYPHGNPTDAEERADALRDIARRCGQYDDTYEVYEMRKVES